MYANYHTHTVRCLHASGTEREYVERACANGLKILGFSDHAPYLFPADYYSGMRMRPHETASYCETIEALRAEFSDRIQLHIGFEMEYYPKYFDDTIRFLHDYPIEYLILGQHFLFNEIDRVYSGAATEDESVLAQYVTQCETALRTEKFTYFAHPDLIRYTGNDAVYRRYITRLIRTAKELDVPLELNILGLSTKRAYPNERFWQLVAEADAPCIIGCDAHHTEDVAKPEDVRAAYDYLARFGLTPLKQITFHSPF